MKKPLYRLWNLQFFYDFIDLYICVNFPDFFNFWLISPQLFIFIPINSYILNDRKSCYLPWEFFWKFHTHLFILRFYYAKNRKCSSFQRSFQRLLINKKNFCLLNFLDQHIQFVNDVWIFSLLRDNLTLWQMKTIPVTSYPSAQK